MKATGTTGRRGLRRFGRAIGVGAGGVALGWLGYAATAWYRYGHVAKTRPADPLLDPFMPSPEVAERHEIRVTAPAEITYAAARDLDINRSPLVRGIFRGREVLLGADRADAAVAGESLLQQTLRLGWGILAEEPGREVVVGAVTRPWEADVRFERLPPDEFAAFDRPGYVKIIWSLAADPLGAAASVFRTATRAAATDAYARKRFRRYWAVFSPGILLIRRESLRLVKADAEAGYWARTRPRRAAPVERG